MLLYHDEAFLAHQPGPGHPESPARLRAIREVLRNDGLWERCRHPPCPRASSQDLRRVHSPSLLTALKQAAAAAERNGLAYIDPDTSLSSGSLEAAEKAAGAAVDATSRVLSGEDSRALLLVRPPGHHATPTRAMGFCLLNSVAVAAAWAVAEGGAKRVAVLDFDVHHGNGTQDAFYESGEVFYASTHRSPFYPGTGRPEERGSGEGRGTTLNLPLPMGCGDSRFLSAWETAAAEIRRFSPKILFLSAGFDAWKGDPVGGLGLEEETYRLLTRRLVELAEDTAEGRIVSLLEGGYHLGGTASCLLHHARELFPE